MLHRKYIFALAVSLVLSATRVHAQDNGALLELLVKKGLITDQEAASVRADLVKENAATSAGKIKLSTPVTELELYGDARVRYEIRTAEAGAPDTISRAGDNTQRNRFRYRLRLGLRGTLVDDWFFGLRLETSTNPRSTNITFGDDSGVNGPFSKESDRISVGQAYFGYRGVRDLTLTVGKMQNPFVVTSMTWDNDISPEGLAEQWKHTFSFGRGSAGGVQSMSKDGKTVVTAQGDAPQPITVDIFANFGQFVYDDTNPENPVGPAPSNVPNRDAFLLGWQIGAKINFTKSVYLQLAPTLYNYTGTGDTFNNHFVGDPAFLDAAGARVTPNQTGVNSLLVFAMPVEFGWKFGELPMRIFGDFAVNFDGDDRAAAAGHPEKGDQRYAYQIGIGAGKLKTRRDWQLSAFYQHVDQFALDANLVDSDFFDTRVNMEGFVVQGGYALSDAVFFNLSYGYGQQADRSLGTGGVGDAFSLSPLRKYNIFQTDLSVKF
ncbi:MAG: putative porin [Spartobacteria bacterium]